MDPELTLLLFKVSILVCLLFFPVVLSWTLLILEVAENVTARGLAGKAIVNISIGGSKSQALNSAIAALTKAGVTVVVAAGNENVWNFPSFLPQTQWLN